MFKQRSKIILQDEAAAWIARLSSDQVSAEDQRQFSRWLETSPNHKSAFDQMSVLWSDLDKVRFLPSVNEMLVESTAQLAPQAPETRNIENIIPKVWSKGLVAACFLLVAALVVLVPLSSPPPETLLRQAQSTVEVRRYSTAVSERRKITLADGSKIELNTNTSVEVHFSSKKRKVLLLKGEAYFDVAKDKTRPFIVDTGNGEVMAIGTAFNINRYVGKTIITVTEGKVEVTNTQPGATVNRSSYVTPNQKIIINEHGLGRVRAISKGENVEWRSNTVVFDEIPLPTALAEVGRYLPFNIHLSDPSLSQIKISGTFSLGSPQATLEAIVSTFNLTKTDTGNGIELRRLDD